MELLTQHFDFGTSVLQDPRCITLSDLFLGLALGLGMDHHFSLTTLLGKCNFLLGQFLLSTRLGHFCSHADLGFFRFGLRGQLGPQDANLVLGRNNGLVGFGFCEFRLLAPVGFDDLRSSNDVRRALTTDGVQVAAIVVYVLDLERVELQAKGAQIVVGFLQKDLGELEPVFIDFLSGVSDARDTTQVTL